MPLAGLQAVVTGQADAIVYDAPLLPYLAMTKLNGEIEVLPSIFERQHYGIALPPGSALREPLNRVLLDKVYGPEWPNIVYRYLEMPHESRGEY